MNGGHGRVPIGFVGDEVIPKLRGREFDWYNDRTTRKQGRKETCEESVYVKQRHHQECSILRGELVGELDVS